MSHFRWFRCGHYFTLVVRLNASPPLLDQSMSSSRATPDFAHLTSARRLQLGRFRMPETQFSSVSISALRTSGPGTSARAAAAWSWPGCHFEQPSDLSKRLARRKGPQLVDERTSQMLEGQKPYDESRYLQALQKKTFSVWCYWCLR